MRKKIISTIILCAISLITFAQLPSFLWKLENGKLVNPHTYQFDVYLYNTGETNFELRGGTIAFNVNSAWRNGGTIEVSTLTSELVSEQQKGGALYSSNSSDYLRKIINMVSKGAGTIITSKSKVNCFTIQLTNSVVFSKKSNPKFSWKFDLPPGAGFNCSNAKNSASVTVVAIRGSKEVVENQKNCLVP
ncbi:MAG: hypothetical protein NTU43_11880 [Bacteroidetes bacterium]|nr:hypothetical protein [Bacteroidota bacterium]